MVIHSSASRPYFPLKHRDRKGKGGGDKWPLQSYFCLFYHFGQITLHRGMAGSQQDISQLLSYVYPNLSWLWTEKRRQNIEKYDVATRYQQQSIICKPQTPQQIFTSTVAVPPRLGLRGDHRYRDRSPWCPLWFTLFLHGKEIIKDVK